MDAYELIDVLKEDEYAGRILALKDSILHLDLNRVKKMRITCKTEQDANYKNHYLPELEIEFYEENKKD